jgi:hypothetical protein
MNVFPNFEAVQVLTVPQLEGLLQSGDGPERVWAAWSLGLRLVGSAVPVLAAAVDQTPDAGVRATLAVMLAGHGRRDILTVLATDDPDADVRASACLHLAGTSLPQMAWVRELLESRLRDDPAIPVQVVLLDLVIAGQISIDPQRLSDALAHPALRIRERAAEFAFSIWLRDKAMPVGLSILLDDEDLDIRTQVRFVAVDRLGSAGFVGLLAETSGLSPEIVAWHLKELARAGATVSWSAVAPLAVEVAGIEVELLRILDDGDPASRPWLLKVVAGNEWPASTLAQPKLLPLLELTPLTPAEVVDAERVRTRLDDSLAAVEEEPEEWMDDDDLEELEEWRTATRVLREAIDHAIVTAPLHVEAPDDLG